MKHSFAKKTLPFLLMAACLIPGASVSAAAEDSLSEHLRPLEPFIGKTWRGTFQGDAENPAVDVSRWERALNGQAVRILHSVNDGAYGGETIITWDREKEQLIFYYFTTAGFYTHGTFTIEDGKFISHEMVTGNDQGITEVKAVGEVLPDGTMKGSSQYLKNGEWVPGHSIIYVEDPTAEVRFR